MTKHHQETAIVTGATSGIGFQSALRLAKLGYGRVIVTGRSLKKAQDAADKLKQRHKRGSFEAIALDLNDKASINKAVQSLTERARTLAFIVLNAGIVGADETQRTAEGVEQTLSSSVIGHHVFFAGLLENKLVAREAKIVISGSEAARGDVPGMTLTDIPEFAEKHFGGDRAQAVETIARVAHPYEYKAFPHYAMVKLLVSYWAAALSRRLPHDISVYAISPGSTPDTDVMRNQGAVIRFIVRNVIGTIGKVAGLGASVKKAADRYISAHELGPQDSGRFYASPPKKMVGPLVEQTQPHILDRESQEAAWKAIEKISGAAIAQLKVVEAA